VRAVETSPSIAELFLNHAQIGAHGSGIVSAELEVGHVGMAARDPPFKRPGKLIEIDLAAKRTKRRGVRVPAFAPGADRMAAPAELGNQGLAVTDWILRSRSEATVGQYDE